MTKSYSVISDLYGVEQQRRKPEGQISTWLIIVLALAGICIYESVHPVLRLRANPPADFIAATAHSRMYSGTARDQVASTYWSLAAESVAKKYSYGDTLPSTPPRDFTTASGADYGTCVLYWQKFREMWNQQTTWVTSYQVNIDWISGTLDSLRNFSSTYMNINI